MKEDKSHANYVFMGGGEKPTFTFLYLRNRDDSTYLLGLLWVHSETHRCVGPNPYTFSGSFYCLKKKSLYLTPYPCWATALLSDLNEKHSTENGGITS